MLFACCKISHVHQHSLCHTTQRFDSAPGEAATLDAVWTVRRTKDGRTETGRTLVREAVQENSYEALVAAHSWAVARLSQDIADAARALDRSRQ
jgi:uncharacterized lipoprotein YmbA